MQAEEEQKQHQGEEEQVAADEETPKSEEDASTSTASGFMPSWTNPWADASIQNGNAAQPPLIPMPFMQLPPSSFYNQQQQQVPPPAGDGAQAPNPYQQPQNAAGNRFSNKEEFLAYNTGYNEGYVQGYYCGMNNMAMQQQQRRNYYYANRGRGGRGRGRGNYRGGTGQRRHYYHNRTHFPGTPAQTADAPAPSATEE